MVVLPQPEGPMKETNSPSATCKDTFDSASTLPSDVSKVSETLRISTARRCGVDPNSVVAIATLSMRTASIGVTNGPRPPDRSVTRGLSGFNDFGSCNAINKYWQSRLQWRAQCLRTRRY